MSKSIKLKNNVYLSDKSIKYESGTFTPTIKGLTNAGTITYSFNYGHYTKIGNLLFYDFKMGISKIENASGMLQINGIPYSDSSFTNAQNNGTLIVSGDLFQSNNIRMLWFGNGLIISTPNNGLGGMSIANTTNTNYIYGTGIIFVNE